MSPDARAKPDTGLESSINPLTQPVLDYADPAVTGPGPFDRFMGAVLYTLSSICVFCAVFTIGWLLVKHRFTATIVLCATVGVCLTLGMAAALFWAGRMISTIERRQG